MGKKMEEKREKSRLSPTKTALKCSHGNTKKGKLNLQPESNCVTANFNILCLNDSKLFPDLQLS